MKKRITKIELFKQNMNFAAGHFTIFSESERENLHGHSFFVHATIEAEIIDNGMTFDYGVYKKSIINICNTLDEVFLLPSQSPYLQIEESEDYIYALFNNGKEKISFLKRDVKILPICNITVEELSYWFLEQLLINVKTQQDHLHLIHAIEVKIFSGPGQSGSSYWSRT